MAILVKRPAGTRSILPSWAILPNIFGDFPMHLRHLLLAALAIAGTEAKAFTPPCFAAPTLLDGVCLDRAALDAAGIGHIRIDPRYTGSAHFAARAYVRNEDGVWTLAHVGSAKGEVESGWPGAYRLANQLGYFISNPLHGRFAIAGGELPMNVSTLEIARVGDHWRFVPHAKAQCAEDAAAFAVTCRRFHSSVDWQALVSFNSPIRYHFFNPAFACEKVALPDAVADALPACDVSGLKTALEQMFPADGAFLPDGDDVVLSSGTTLLYRGPLLN